MAFQIHRLFTPGSTTFSTSSHLPIMSQCKTLQNYPSICSQFPPFSNASSYNKCAPLRLRESINLCGFTSGRLKNQRFKVERDSFMLSRSFGDYKQNFVSMFPFRVKYSDLCNPSCLDRKLGFSFSFQQCARGRFFSVKASENSQSNKKLTSVKDVVSNTSPKLSDRFKKGAKSFVVQSSSSGTQGVVSNQSVKKSASEAIASVPNFLHVQKPKDEKIGLTKAPVKLSDRFRKQVKSFIVQSNKSNEEVGLSSQSVKSASKKLNVAKPKNGKKDVKLESSSAKSGAKKKSSQSQGNQKQLKDKKEKGLSGSTAPPGDAQVNGSKQASLTKKANVKQIRPAGEESLPTDEKIKKIIGKPTTKRKSQKKVTVDMKSDKAPTKVKSTPVPVEVKTRPLSKELRSLYPPTGKSVVVVESLTKAKVIQGYLGDMFEVLPSYGHVRDLAGRSGSVRPDDDFSMVWEVPSTAWTHLKSIKVALNGADNLILASDPDREGEAIAWHITEMLQQQDALRDDINISRVVFHEITEQSIKSALQSPRDIDANLVHAYLARRALDYLIGFSISPLLWRKLPGCQSAGRVQSAALALICDREMEIDECKPQEYWTVEVDFNKVEAGFSADSTFASRLTYLDFKKLEQLSISSREEANAIEQKMTSTHFEVSGSKRSKTRRNPPAPYITSTLQQDAANKLNFPASYTMKLAQKLYEGVKLANDEATGLITYMRTDGLHISDVAAEDIRSLVIERYGHDFASESTRKYFKKVKNAQEAHEAIRPTSIRRLPSMLTGVIDEDSLNLYILIWSRTMACQMVPTVIDQIQIDISGAENFLGLRSTCSKIEFLGYEAVYKDAEAVNVRYGEKVGDSRDEAFEVLAKLKKGDLLNLGKVELKQHFTQPPSRYSEGSLVKKLEELGIGRPSTYASTIKVLQDRKYVTVKSRTLTPEFRGRMVSAFLSHHFSEVTDYSFTADMETELDNVSAGTTEWKGLIKDYWTRFKTYCTLAGNIEIRQVEKMLEKTFADILFASLPNKSRTCPSCLTGTLIFKVSRFGSGYFLGCDQHPACKYIAKTIYKEDEDDENPQATNVDYEPKVLGLHPTSNEKVLLKSGPYGSYVQLGEDRKGYSPKRASTCLVKDVSAITLEDALDLLQYPLLLGNHPEDGRPVLLKIARYGLSVRHRRTIAPVPKKLKPKDVTFEKALQLLLSKDAKQCGRPKRKPALEEVLEAAG